MGEGKDAPDPLRVLVPPQPAKERAKPVAPAQANTLWMPLEEAEGMSGKTEQVLQQPYKHQEPTPLRTGYGPSPAWLAQVFPSRFGMDPPARSMHAWLS